MKLHRFNHPWREKCRSGKVMYPTREEARLEAKRMRKTVGPRLKPYKCVYCNQWHNGHNRPPEFRSKKRLIEE